MIAYESARATLRTGDIVLWKGNSLLSRAIRIWSKYSHASLVVRFNPSSDGTTLGDQVFLIEALGSGLEFRRMSTRILKYDGKVHVLQPVMAEESRRAVFDFAFSRLADGIGYDYGGLFANVFGRVSSDANRYFCSEFAYAALAHCGIVPKRDKAPRPGDMPDWIPGDVFELAPFVGASA